MTTTAADEGQALRAALLKVRATIRQQRNKRERLGEEATKSALIVPILTALGWDTTDLDQVLPEYRYKPKANPVDYAILLRREPCLFVEAKGLDTNLDDHGPKSQILNYANYAGVEWCVLTDGDRYCIYKTRAPGDVDQKLFRIVSIADADQEPRTLETLGLISKENFDADIEAYWEAEFVDRKVHSAVVALFEKTSPGLVRLIRKQTDLKPSDIASSLRRARFSIDFPEPTAPPPPPPPPRIAVSDLISAGLVKPGDRWRQTTKGREVSAEVTADGSLVVEGQSVRTPSAAACRATGWKAMDGWSFWRFRDADGTEKTIDHLRQRFLAGKGPPFTKPAEVSLPATGGIQVQIAGEAHSCRFARDILVQVAEWLIRTGRLSARDCPVVVTRKGGGRKRCLVSATPQHAGGHAFRSPARLSNGTYIEVHASKTDLVRYARHLLKWAGQDERLLVVP